MIPSRRLLWLTGGLLFPLAVTGAVVPHTGWLTVAVLLLVAIAALADLLVSRPLLEGVQVTLASPQRLYRDRPQALPLRLSSAWPLPLRVGLALPENVQTREEIVPVALAGGGATQQLDWLVTPTRRGRYTLPTAHLETSSRLGFWDLRRALALATELRVYPSIRPGDALVALARQQAGPRARRQVGKGREFEKLREYQPGDGLDEIHWKATARRGQPITKVFQIERTQEIYVLVDASRLSSRLIDGEPALERALNAALLTGLAAERRGDHFGLVTFGSQVHGFVRAASGKAHYAACREAIYRLQPEAAPAAFDELFTFLRARLHRRSLLIVLTALDDPMLAEGFRQASRLLGQRHVVVAAMAAPPGTEPLFSRDVEQPGEIFERLGGHLAWRSLRQLELDLQREGIRFRLFPPAQLTAGLIGLYDEVKQRQLI